MDELNLIRQELDKVDEGIVDLLAERVKLINKVAAVKAKYNIESHQPDRYKKMIEKLHKQARDNNVSPELIDNIWAAIHSDSQRQQNDLNKR